MSETQREYAANYRKPPVHTRFQKGQSGNPRGRPAKNLPALLAEVRSWLATFDDLDQLQAQVSESGLAVGRVRTVNATADSPHDEFVDVLLPRLEEAVTVLGDGALRQGTDNDHISLLEANAWLRALARQLSNLVGDLPPLRRSRY